MRNLKYGEIRVIKPEGMCVLDAYCMDEVPGTLRRDNGREIITRVKTSRGKMICNNYGAMRTLRSEDGISERKVNRVVIRPDEVTIIV